MVQRRGVRRNERYACTYMTTVTRVLLPIAAVVVATSWSSTASADTLGDLAGQLGSALEGGSMAVALGVIFLAGLATALTPCVYPMIAITVSVFGAREAKSKAQGAMLSLAFVLGIAALFTPLGVVSALFGFGMGELNSSIWVSGFLAILFLVMAASMFGAFDMTLPDKLQNKLSDVGGSGVKGAFALGFVNGLIAAPCTGPVITVLMGYVGSTGSVAFGATSFFVYALGLGVLFFLVGTFAVSLPKSGQWLEWIKSGFGIVMVVLAVYYLKSFLPDVIRPTQRSLMWWLVPAVLAVAGIAIGAIHLSFKWSPLTHKIRKGAGVSMTVMGLLGLIFSLEALPPGAHIEWLQDYEQAREMALSTRKPLLVDFGADWCNACTELEHQAMSDPRVVSEAQRFVPVRVDLSADQATEAKWNLLREEYEQPGLPLVVMHDGEGEIADRITGLVSADEFLERMQTVN